MFYRIAIPSPVVLRHFVFSSVQCIPEPLVSLVVLLYLGPQFTLATFQSYDLRFVRLLESIRELISVYHAFFCPSAQTVCKKVNKFALNQPCLSRENDNASLSSI